VLAKDFFDDGLRASRHTDQHRVCLHIERCGKQLLFRTLELEFLLEASREQPTDRETSVGPDVVEEGSQGGAFSS
jgi:hypothetical protein